MLSLGFAKLSCTIFTFAYMMLISYNIRCPYIRHWIHIGNTFKYFCCIWFFRIIFISIYSFNQRFEIFINNRCCFIIFSVWLNPNILYYLCKALQDHKKNYFHTLIYEIQVCFCSKWMKTIQTTKIKVVFKLFLLIIFFFFYWKIMPSFSI